MLHQETHLEEDHTATKADKKGEKMALPRITAPETSVQHQSGHQRPDACSAACADPTLGCEYLGVKNLLGLRSLRLARTT